MKYVKVQNLYRKHGVMKWGGEVVEDDAGGLVGVSGGYDDDKQEQKQLPFACTLYN